MPDTKLCLNGCFKVLPVADFGPHPHMRDGLSSRCRSCEADRMMLSKHGLTKAHKALIALDQDGCAICGTTDPGGKGWMVDHDRSCCPGDRSCAACRRGILCHGCNTALGYAADDAARLRRMADYIEAETRMGEFKSLVDLKFKSDMQVEVHHVRTDETDGTKKAHPVATKEQVVTHGRVSTKTSRGEVS